MTDQNIELVLVDAEMGDELSRVFVNPDELGGCGVGFAYKHQHETAKWSVWVLASDFDSDSDVLNIAFVDECEQYVLSASYKGSLIR